MSMYRYVSVRYLCIDIYLLDIYMYRYLFVDIYLLDIYVYRYLSVTYLCV